MPARSCDWTVQNCRLPLFSPPPLVSLLFLFPSRRWARSRARFPVAGPGRAESDRARRPPPRPGRTEGLQPPAHPASGGGREAGAGAPPRSLPPPGAGRVPRPPRRWISYTQLAQVRGALQTRAGGGDPDAGSSRENMQPFWAEADKEPPAAATAPTAPRGSRTPHSRGAAAPKGRNPRPPAAAGGPPPPPGSQLSVRSHLHGLL